jgi:hypothetical protein
MAKFMRKAVQVETAFQTTITFPTLLALYSTLFRISVWGINYLQAPETISSIHTMCKIVRRAIYACAGAMVGPSVLYTFDLSQ